MALFGGKNVETSENDAGSYVADTINPFTSLADTKWDLIFLGNRKEAMKNKVLEICRVWNENGLKKQIEKVERSRLYLNTKTSLNRKMTNEKQLKGVFLFVSRNSI